MSRAKINKRIEPLRKKQKKRKYLNHGYETPVDKETLILAEKKPITAGKCTIEGKTYTDITPIIAGW